MIAITPFIQQEKLGEYQDKIVDLHRADMALNQTIPDSIRENTEWLLRQVNCFYSNKIEGNPTHPKDLLRTQENKTNGAEELTGALRELLVHLEVQIKAQSAATDIKEVCTEAFIKDLHKSFYEGLPDEHRMVKDIEGRSAIGEDGRPLLITPGEYRNLAVKVGAHVPPEPNLIPSHMGWLEQMFNPGKARIHGLDKVIAAAALHHRLAWIHPFQDGNGRVIRLLTDCYMRCAGFGGYGLWSITRGFGRDTQKYYAALAEADKPRQGNTDGRGKLSDAGLIEFTKYFIDTALDQVQFFSGLLEPRKLGIRVDYYFDMRAKGGLPGASGKDLPLLKIDAREIYKALLAKGPMSRQELIQYLGKGEQTLRPTIKQMDEEGLISAKPKRNITLKLASNAVEFLFPQLW